MTQRQIITIGMDMQEFLDNIQESVKRGLSNANILPDDTVVDRNFLRDNYKLSRREIQRMELEGLIRPYREDNRHKYSLSEVLRALNLK